MARNRLSGKQRTVPGGNVSGGTNLYSTGSLFPTTCTQVPGESASGFADGSRHFTAKTDLLGPAYFRVFRWGSFYYAIARAGVFLRSRDGVTPFVQGPRLFDEDPTLILRHLALYLQANDLWVYYSRIGDRPERILLSRIPLTPDWHKWRASSPVTVLQPETAYEGADVPVEASKPDEAPGRVQQLRDPGLFREGQRTYLLYSIAGESRIAIAELRPR